MKQSPVKKPWIMANGIKWLLVAYPRTVPCAHSLRRGISRLFESGPMQRRKALNVRYGSLVHILTSPRHVRFTSKSDQAIKELYNKTYNLEKMLSDHMLRDPSTAEGRRIER